MGRNRRTTEQELQQDVIKSHHFSAIFSERNRTENGQQNYKYLTKSRQNSVKSR